MLRTRVCLLTALTAILVGGPVLAYWPVFLAVPGVFGQECPRGAETKRVMPYADLAPMRCLTDESFETCRITRCELLGDCLSAWRKLWEQGRFRDAYDLAKCAVQAAPDDLYAQHAFAVSQLVNEHSRQDRLNPHKTLAAQYQVTWQAARAPIPVALPSCGLPPVPTQARTTTAITTASSGPAAVCPIDSKVAPKACAFDIELEFNCPLVGFVSSLFGGKQPVKAGCFTCPLTAGSCAKADDCCKQVAGQAGFCNERMVRGQHGPSVIYIVREATPTMVPSMPPLMAMPPLPPPHFAPPPPLAFTEDGIPYLPLPMPSAPAQRVQPTLYDPAEQCDAVCPIMPPMPAGMRITQQGRRVELNSPNYHVECDRIQSGPNGQVILEGNVTLISRRHGQTMNINAERIMLNMKTDQFVAEQAKGMESSRVNIAPVGDEKAALRMIHWMTNGRPTMQNLQKCTTPEVYRPAQGERIEELLIENEVLRPIRGELRRHGSIDHPTHLTPIRVHGGVGP